MSEWKNIPKNIKQYHGFIYIITNKKNNRKYVGKKFFWKKKTLPPLKGRKNKRHKLVESDWKNYWGSCKELLEDVKKFGEDCFERKIVKCYKSKGELAYFEAKLQFDKDVLFRDDFYNRIVNCRLHERSVRK